MARTYGPYEKYREVLTDHGVFGVPPGQVLSFGPSGETVYAKASPVAPVEADTIPDEVENEDEVETFDSSGTTDPGEPGPAPDEAA